LIRSGFDLNSDGKLDVVVEGSDGAYTLLGNGAGSYSSSGAALSTDIPGYNGFSAAVGDINGDGCPDLVTVSRSSSLFSTQVFLNNCSGSMGSRRVIQSNYQVTGVYLGNVMGTVGNWQMTTSNSECASAGHCTYDLVEIGSNWNPRSMVWSNTGTATPFTSYSSLFAATGPFFYAAPPAYDNAVQGSPATGDINNDGYPDFIIKTGGGAAIYLGGSGNTYTAETFEVGTTELGATWWFGRQTMLFDVNGDGNLDFIAGNYNNNSFGTVAVTLGNGDGSFGSQSAFSTDQTGCTTNGGVRSVGMGDMNKDGIPDLIVGHACNGTARISLFLGYGDGTYNSTSPVILSGSGGYADQVVVADVDGDGNLDIIVGNDNANIQIYRGKGNGSFYTPVSAGMGVAAGISMLELGDINNDGILDYVYSSQNGTTWGFLEGGATGTIQGTAQTFTGAPVTNGIGLNFMSMRLVDWDQDGKLDVLAFKYNTGIQFFKGLGNLSFTTPTQSFLSPDMSNGSYFTPAILDLNGDGLPDILNASASGNSDSSAGVSFNLSH
jgi:hypothetical protein